MSIHFMFGALVLSKTPRALSSRLVEAMPDTLAVLLTYYKDIQINPTLKWLTDVLSTYPILLKEFVDYFETSDKDVTELLALYQYVAVNGLFLHVYVTEVELSTEQVKTISLQPGHRSSLIVKVPEEQDLVEKRVKRGVHVFSVGGRSPDAGSADAAALNTRVVVVLAELFVSAVAPARPAVCKIADCENPRAVGHRHCCVVCRPDKKKRPRHYATSSVSSGPPKKQRKKRAPETKKRAPETKKRKRGKYGKRSTPNISTLWGVVQMARLKHAVNEHYTGRQYGANITSAYIQQWFTIADYVNEKNPIGETPKSAEQCKSKIKRSKLN